MSDFKVGQTVVFQGYAQLAEGQEQIFSPGERIVLHATGPEESFVAKSETRTFDDGEPVTDTVFQDEIESTGRKEDEPAPKATKTKGKKVKAAPAVTEPTVEEPQEEAGQDRESYSDDQDRESYSTETPAADDPPFDLSADIAELEAQTPDLADVVADLPEDPELTPAEETREVEVIDDEGPGEPKVKKVKGKTRKSKSKVKVVDEPTGGVFASMIDDVIAENQDAISAAKALIEADAQNNLTLGGVLWHIYENGIFREEGYSGKRGFQDFVHKSLGIDYRKAMTLIATYKVFKQISLDPAQAAKLQEIGWSKAEKISRIGTLKNEEGENFGLALLEEKFDELADFAVQHTRDEVASMIKETYMDVSTSESERVRAVKFKFTLVGEAGEMARRAIEHAKSTLEDDGTESQAFEIVCGEYLASTEGTEQTLAEAIALVEARFNVKLTATNEAGEEIDVIGEVSQQT